MDLILAPVLLGLVIEAQEEPDFGLTEAGLAGTGWNPYDLSGAGDPFLFGASDCLTNGETSLPAGDELLPSLSPLAGDVSLLCSFGEMHLV